MRTISSQNGMSALMVLFALVWVAEVARAQGGGGTATHEVGHWLAKYSVPPQVAPGMINDETVRFWVHVQLRIFAGGRARGIIQLREVGGRRNFLFRVVGGKLIADPQTGPKLELRLMHVGASEESLGMIGRPTRPNAAEPRAIYISHQGDLLCIFNFVDELVANSRPAN
jgi:hypothetical protein